MVALIASLEFLKPQETSCVYTCNDVWTKQKKITKVSNDYQLR